jgi:tetratricopeptide (TPR) repeat protein
MIRPKVPSNLLQTLEGALIKREVRSGINLLDTHMQEIQRLDPKDAASTSFLLCMAQWSDLGYRDLAFFDDLLARFSGVDRAQLRMLDFLKLRMAEAYRFLAVEQTEEAIVTLNLVIQTSAGVLPEHLAFLANFWKGRAHRKRGDYTEAMLHIAAARTIAEGIKASRLVAVAKIHESWLVFQKGERQYAFQLLDESEKVLRSTNHALSLGNIESARGRFVRRAGEYTRALSHFEAAISIYTKSYPNHPNLARALVNAAYAKRLIALDLQHNTVGGHAKGATHARYLQIAREALELLRRAGEIYALHHHQGGTGAVLVNAAHLHLESGDIDQAATESERAFTLGEERHDQILMARAKTALTAVELARSDEQLGESGDIALHANLAVEHAERSIALSLLTQNKRLLAEAYLARGSAAAADYFQDWELAKDYVSKAASLLGHDDRDHLYKQLNHLKAKILGSTRIDERLKLWADGQFGNKTFQEVQEEFAELVIPRAWINTGRNVSQLSKQLSISPKKVRRILRSSKALS